MNDSKFLLVLKTAQHLSKVQIESLAELITPTAEALGAEPMVLGSGFDVELKMGSEALLLRVCEALEKIAAQGEAPVLETQEGPLESPTLNARPGTLNSRMEIDVIGNAAPSVDQIAKSFGLKRNGA